MELAAGGGEQLKMSPTSGNATVRRCMLDEALERYIDWREACAAVRAAYAQWSHASAQEGGLWFAAYNAALDREASAATLYSGILNRIAAA
jgi:hypothetical protein